MTVRAILSDPAYEDLKRFVLDHTGLAYYADKDEDLATRLSRRIGALKAQDCLAYLTILRRNAGEIDALVGELTIGETYFFRQREHFEMLRSTILPELIARKSESRQLRIWSAGCATGAEPYSIAMMVRREFAEQLMGWDVLILGTDINADFLEQAKSGNYSEWTLRDVPDEIKNCCFERDGRRWILNAEYREAVMFRQHNLVDESDSPSPDGVLFDIILCRNVMIYFSTERTRAVMAQFFRWLDESGWLLLGHAECSASIFEEFVPVRGADAIAFRKPAAEAERADEAAREWRPWGDNIPEISESAVEREAPAAPRPVEERLAEARTLADQGAWSAAAAICGQVLADDPLNASAHFTLGLTLAHTEPVERAIAELRRAIYVDRRFTLAYYHLGALLQRAGDGREARKAFRNAMNLLDEMDEDELLEHGDGIRADELRELTRMHEEVLGE